MKCLVCLVMLLFLSLPVQAGDYTYVVRPGDTLYDIARSYDLCWELLADQNGINNPSLLRIGTVLVLPGSADWDKAGAFHDFSADEAELLARLIHAEARGESLEGQIAVGAVVINRVKSEDFPNSLHGVIHQPGQFTPVARGALPSTASPRSVEAAKRALAGEDPTHGALFFFNPRRTSNPSFWETRRVIRTIGNHSFAI